ncbi:MAG: GyrI-like domain-containing protein [Acidimicrobiia bacterium]
MTAIDRKKELRAWYSPGPEPELVVLPELGYLMIDGAGDPNTAPAYTAAVQALYASSYGIRKRVADETGRTYVVMPLEGLWWVPDMTRFTTSAKSEWQWTMMILQPHETTAGIADAAIADAIERKGVTSGVRLEQLTEGRCAQVMHHGPYAEEGPTIERLHAFIAAEGLSLGGHHHEIYLSDPRKCAPERMRTIIRQPVE